MSFVGDHRGDVVRITKTLVTFRGERVRYKMPVFVTGREVKDLHQISPHHCMNKELLLRLQQDPYAPLRPGTDSPHHVCAVMADVLHSHHLMKPPLFEPFLPFMNGVLNSALQNQSSTLEKIAQLQHIQFLIEQQPPQRRDLITKLTRHLVSVSERLNIPSKNLALASDENQPLELSMLLMYLNKYHQWLFRTHHTLAGWPKTIADLGFTSNSMVVNIRHVVQPVQEPMDTCDDTADIENRYTSPPAPQPTKGGVQDSLELLSIGSEERGGLTIVNTASFKGLVQQFMDVTNLSEVTAINLLKACRGNLEMAMELHFSKQEAMPDLEEAVGDVAMETSSCAMTSSDATVGTPGKSEDSSSCSAEGINESILSLLVKLLTAKANTSSTSPGRSPAYVDDVHYLSDLLDVIGRSSPENATALRKVQPQALQVSPSPSSPDSDMDDSVARTMRKRQLARERQQKLLAEFASKQKLFMEKTLNKDPVALDAADGMPKEKREEVFDCVICGQASISTEDKPIGMVTLLQPSAVLKHRAHHVRHTQLPLNREEEESRVINCETTFRNRFEDLRRCFDLIPSLDASATGTEGGVHIQSCGHLLHVDCHQSYLKSLQEEDANQLYQVQPFNPRNGEFTCPLCRQLGNCVLPVVPSHIIPNGNMASKKNTMKSHTERTSDLHTVLRKYKLHTITKLTASALNFNVLGAAIKAVVESVSALDGESHRCSFERKFSLLYRMARTNLELEQVDKVARKLSSPRKSCFGPLMRAFQFHSQTLVGPLLSVWSELTGTEDLKESSSSGTISFQDCPLLLRDAPSLLIQMMLSWPAPLSCRDFMCFVQLLFNLVFTQALVETCCKFVGDEKLSWQDLGKKAASQEIVQGQLSADLLLGYVCRMLSNSTLIKEDHHTGGISQSVWSPHTVERSLQDSCLGFLRSASAMAALCYGVEIPKVQDNDAEFRVLASTLGLCDPFSDSRTESFSCINCLKWPYSKPRKMIRRWCDALLLCFTQRKAKLNRELLPNMSQWPPPRLLQLPERYDSLIQHYRKRKCTKCGSTPDDPAVCLVCGKFTCLQGSCCVDGTGTTDKYECIQHALNCGRGTGIFLIVLSSVIIIIRADRVCIWGSVYLDSFGEEDRDLRRGKPLFLSQDRFNRLEEQWLTHSFDYMCKRWKRHMNTL